jgi:Tol biopolymer transport system component
MSIPLVAGLIAFVAIIVFALAALGFYTRLKREREASTLQLTYDRAEDTQPDVSPDGKRVVFVSNRGGRLNIWIMRSDGGDPKNLTRDQGDNGSPAWSPDGKQIAFQSSRIGGLTRIFLMNADGSGQHAVGSVTGERPAWSPDGKRIAYQATHHRFSGIYVFDIASGNERPLTDPGTRCAEPAWSPDGKNILHVRETKPSTVQLFLMDAAGGNVQQLTHSTSLTVRAPAWSPDGARIAFNGGFEKHQAIFLMKADGTEASRLTGTDGDQGAASWSRDGRRIFFESNAAGNSDIFSMPVPPGTGRRLTFDNGEDQSPSVSPTGGQLVFSSRRSGHPNIFVQDLGTGQVHNLTNNPADDEHPAWSPDGTRIAFDSNRTGRKQVFVMNTDGSDPRQIQAGDGEASAPAWSPDSAALVISAGRLVVVHLSDGSTREIVSREWAGEWPAWSPDGAWIAFSSARYGDSRVFLVPSGGGTIRSLTNGGHPTWRSDGVIAFECNCGWGTQIFTMRLDGSDVRVLTSTLPRNVSPAFSRDGFRLFFSTNRDGKFEIYEIHN